MQKLFENLLDHHPNFLHLQEKEKTSKKSGRTKNMNRKCLAKNLLSSKKKTQKKINPHAYSFVIAYGNYSFD